MRYLVVLEKAKANWAAYSPDVPGCVAIGTTAEEALEEFAEALRLHLASSVSLSKRESL